MVVMTDVQSAIQRALYQAALEGDTSPKIMLSERVVELLLHYSRSTAPIPASALKGQALREALKYPGRSQTGLARAMGLDPSMVNRICSGLRDVRADEAEKIVAYLSETAHNQGSA